MKRKLCALIGLVLALAQPATAGDLHWERHFGAANGGATAYQAGSMRALSETGPAATVPDSSEAAPRSPIPVSKTADGTYVVEYHQDPEQAASQAADPYAGIPAPTGLLQPAPRQPACTPVDAHGAAIKPIAPCETSHLDPDPYYVYDY